MKPIFRALLFDQQGSVIDRISNKYKKIPHTKKMVPTTEDEQFRKEGDHEPLVGKEDYEKAQLMAPKRWQEVLVKGEEYLGGEEPESLINID